jgi:hypothetical protein
LTRIRARLSRTKTAKVPRHLGAQLKEIMNDQTIEQDIQAAGKTAPRITPVDIEANIVGAHYFTAADGIDGADFSVMRAEEPTKCLTLAPLSEDPDLSKTTVMGPLSLLTFCVLILRNGFTVTGESACASPENFDAEIGQKIARENAVRKIWPLMGYELRTRLAGEAA